MSLLKHGSNAGNCQKVKITADKGSSSILVVLIMVTLVVLGLIALMSTFSELKLARKNADWIKTYYILDSKAENLLSEVDACLRDADKSAETYISEKAYERESSNSENVRLPSGIQKVVNAGWQNARAANSEESYLDNLYLKLYYMFSLRNLNASGIRDLTAASSLDFKNEAVFEDSAALPENGVVTVSSTVREKPAGDDRALWISLSVKSGRSGGAGSIGTDTGSAGSGGRYEITAWKEVPKEFEYEELIDFEDPEIGEFEDPEVNDQNVVN